VLAAVLVSVRTVLEPHAPTTAQRRLIRKNQRQRRNVSSSACTSAASRKTPMEAMSQGRLPATAARLQVEASAVVQGWQMSQEAWRQHQ